MPVSELTTNNISSNSVSLFWTFGFDGNSEITSVIVSYITVDNFMTMVSMTTILPNGGSGPVPNETTLIGLEPHTQYSFSVSVSNAVGTGLAVTIQDWTLPLSAFTHRRAQRHSQIPIVQVYNVHVHMHSQLPNFYTIKLIPLSHTYVTCTYFIYQSQDLLQMSAW